ncbi:uncharacterized protein LOC128954734 [Oppia nitens]|uniref:uncharacterized protein LOC128954734 n=1 Tax=Oppia nitens TaxID=1686743 RepID=UPI0023DBA328|nr:uncharacterized protein LOC128954734 [Oppia nitens]
MMIAPKLLNINSLYDATVNNSWYKIYGSVRSICHNIEVKPVTKPFGEQNLEYQVQRRQGNKLLYISTVRQQDDGSLMLIRNDDNSTQEVRILEVKKNDFCVLLLLDIKTNTRDLIVYSRQKSPNNKLLKIGERLKLMYKIDLPLYRMQQNGCNDKMLKLSNNGKSDNNHNEYDNQNVLLITKKPKTIRSTISSNSSLKVYQE